MSDEQGTSIFNLLSGSDTSKVLSRSWHPVEFGVTKCEFGTPYALSVTYDSSADRLRLQARFNYWTTDGKVNSISGTPSVVCAKGKHVATVTIPSFDKPDDFKNAFFMIQAGDISGNGTIEISRPMLVEGTEPAAWAPAEGETLTGVGARMSANLIASVKPEITQYGSMADGVLTSTESKDAWQDVATWPITADTLAENQTVHIGISAKWHGTAATTGTAWASVKYADTAGNTNAVNVKIDGITTEWQRLSLSAVVPSGMRVVDFRISADHIDAAFDATNPTLSYGSPVTLASSAHTPYATQDHLAVAAEVEKRGYDQSKCLISDAIEPDVSIMTTTGTSDLYVNKAGVIEFDTNVGTTVTIKFLKDLPAETIVDLVYKGVNE